MKYPQRRMADSAKLRLLLVAACLAGVAGPVASASADEQELQSCTAVELKIIRVRTNPVAMRVDVEGTCTAAPRTECRITVPFEAAPSVSVAYGPTCEYSTGEVEMDEPGDECGTYTLTVTSPIVIGSQTWEPDTISKEWTKDCAESKVAFLLSRLP